MESALCGMTQANMDLGVFRETNLTDGIYMQKLLEYHILAIDAPS